MEFDYFLCMSCGVVVEKDNASEHREHNVLGCMYVIKNPKRKIHIGLISQVAIRKAQEKLEEERWEKRQVKEAKQKLLQQKRFDKQIPSGDIIVNLLEVPC